MPALGQAGSSSLVFSLPLMKETVLRQWLHSATRFLGDGPRIPLVVVSYSTGGHVVHTYDDHVSILKFIERNWSLEPLTGRSRDNLPDLAASPTDPYVRLNSPTIGDLFECSNSGQKASGVFPRLRAFVRLTSCFR